MIRRALQALPWYAAIAVLGAGCGGDGGTEPPPVDWDAIDPIVYSEHVQPIFDMSCNTTECHNASDRALGLSLASYPDVAAGSRFGAVVLPYEPHHSHLIQHLTGELLPRMPLGRDPLDEAVIRFLRRWVEQGAPDDAGTPMYSGVMSKAFVPCQGENEVAVLDLETARLIRMIHVEAPHSVYVDAPNRRVFVSRFENASDNVRVYDADTLELLATGRSGTYPALMRITPDGTQLWVTNFDTFGGDNAVHVLNPDTLEEIVAFQAPFDTQVQPHGLAMTADGSTVYVTNILTDNLSVYCTGCGPGGAPNLVEFNVDLPAVSGLTHQPQQCVLSADESRLFVSALGSDRVFVMDTATLAFPAQVAVGDAPWHLALSPDGAQLWVANWVGESVTVLDVTNPDAPVVLDTLTPTHPADAGRLVLQRPIGITFSPDGQRVWVACANDDGQGSGHHPAPEGEKNPGNVVVFDRVTRQVVSVTEVPNFARFVSFIP